MPTSCIMFLDANRAQPTPARSADRRRSLQQVLVSRTTTPITVHMPTKKCYRLLEVLDGFSSLMSRSTRLDEGNGLNRK
jgi:hypothetical protein